MEDSQETFNQQMTVPPTSHRRLVFFNQTHRQFVKVRSRKAIRQLLLSGHTQGDLQHSLFRLPMKRDIPPIAQVLSPELSSRTVLSWI